VALEPWRGFPIPVLAAPLRADIGSSNDKQPFELIYTVAGTQSLSFLPLAGTRPLTDLTATAGYASQR